MEVDQPNAPNFDVNRFHQVTIRDPIAGADSTFTIPRRYSNLNFLNAGAQGTVVMADDSVTGERVAIKKMQQPFVMTMSAKRAYREFILLTTIKHPNIIRLLNAFTPDTSLQTFGEVYLVMELMTHNLHEVIHRLRLDHKTLSFFVYQSLCAIKHLHTSGVIHRDLKPSNIVVNDRCVLKVLDFGLARKKNVDTSMRMSDYVVTRYYRAPEVILGLPYSEKVDIWSVGCIFAEMINHTVLFPGKDRIDQWTKIYNVMGTPSDDFINQLGQSAAMYVRSLRRANPKPLSEIVPDSNFLPETENPRVNLTANMLKINPDERFSVEDALNHPYVRLWFKDEEVNAPASENRYDQEIDFADKTLQEWKGLIFQEVQRYQSDHDIFNG
ncbi:Protein CBR-KGB-1 [Caenorhabditis briggsae]|uniref:Stress-activated protein kinase JNK n=1 Tax=Caenorhabditis briggsae TaxID=6238 RepID=A8XI46_CAEBR|nr:Protein CBR-KGB-1 [Caenorhabditis briggsae]CAP32320.2 Protein CBR-KGB-1 [Caenorhabditis briggsae]